MENLKIPKWRTRVEILAPGGYAFGLAVYLADAASSHSGPERISDLLNGPLDFFPGHDLDRDQVVFVNRNDCSVVRVLLDIEADHDEHTSIPTENEVRVVLQSGAEVVGLLTYQRPPDRSRVLDYLNEAPVFFPVLEKDQVALINKQHVARVELATRSS
jgi:hypothetical protein